MAIVILIIKQSTKYSGDVAIWAMVKNDAIDSSITQSLTRRQNNENGSKAKFERI